MTKKKFNQANKRPAGDADNSSIDSSTLIAMLKNTSDWLFVLDADGKLVSVKYAENTGVLKCDDWVGQHFSELVTIESVQKVEWLLAQTSKTPSTWRQVNHPVENADDVPVRYSVCLLESKQRLLVGQSLVELSRIQQRMMRTQQALESDFARMSQAKARYRLLFDLSAEALLNIDIRSLKITDANPAAQRLLGTYIAPLKNNRFPTGFDPDSTDALNTLLKQAQLNGRADDVAVCTMDKRNSFLASAALVRDQHESVLMLRLSPIGDTARENVELQSAALFNTMVAKSPDGVLICDSNGQIVSANESFCSMANLPSPSKAIGQSIDNWLGSSAMDYRLLNNSLKENDSVPRFMTVIRSEHGTQIDVEASAAHITDPRFPYTLLIIRNVQSRSAVSDELVVPGAGAPLKELVGRVPLKELVRESTDLIERMCIESALEMTSDNRASAAEMLGVSRQSLYTKLRRFGIPDQSFGQE